MSITQQQAVQTLVADRAKILAYIWTIVRDHHVAEDIYQDVLMQAMQKHDEIDSRDHLLGWARVAARYSALDHLRKQDRQQTGLDPQVLELLEPHWQKLDDRSTRGWTDILQACMQKLSPKSQQLVDLRFWKGLSGAQVADRLGQSAHSVYVAMSRIYRKLNECMRRRMLQGGADA